MRTQFTPESLQNPEMAQSENILRACIHCGFCNATCPTYLITGDENDGPRGRIYLMREMLQSGASPDARLGARTVAHIDNCLSCLGCATTCPSGVDYMRLVDHARVHIETHYRRPLLDRAFRAVLNFILPHPDRFARALLLGRVVAPFAKFFPRRLARMLAMAKAISLPPPRSSRQGGGRRTELGAKPLPSDGEGLGWGDGKKLRVALLTGCVQPSLAPEINAATIRLLNRLGVEVVVPPSTGCCGALSHHLGKTEAAKQFARANINAWVAEPLDAIIINASGCGVQVKQYAHMLRDDPLARDAAHISSITRDISEFLHELGMPEPAHRPDFKVAYHAPCSLQHGQKQGGKVESLLRAAGFTVMLPREAHLCCGAAGSYTLLQPEMSEKLAARKAETLSALQPDIIATGNIGCQVQIAGASQTPVLHWVQLLDWAYGGPRPLT